MEDGSGEYLLVDRAGTSRRRVGAFLAKGTLMGWKLCVGWGDNGPQDEESRKDDQGILDNREGTLKSCRAVSEDRTGEKTKPKEQPADWGDGHKRM